MQLPFTIEQFLAVFAAYNTSVWPMQIILNLLGILAIGLCFRSTVPSQVIAAILAVLWAWTGVAYHWMFFAAVNPAAKIFALLFIAQAGIFLVLGMLKRSLVFGFEKSWKSYIGAVLLLYGMLVYPVLGHILGHTYPSCPTFGAPCPTTIFTFGLLMWTKGRVKWYILILPLIWSLIGFGAALKLGIYEDVGLLVSGLVGTIVLLATRDLQSDKTAL
jgi:hypothetical protein